MATHAINARLIARQGRSRIFSRFRDDPVFGTDRRRELLDHVIVLNEAHLRRLLREFVDYYPRDWTDLSLGEDPRCERGVCAPSAPTATVVSLPPIGGLHHRHE